MCEIEAFPHRQAGLEPLMGFLLGAHRERTQQHQTEGDSDLLLKNVQ